MSLSSFHWLPEYRDMRTDYPHIHAYIWQRISRTHVTQKYLPDNRDDRLLSHLQVVCDSTLTQQQLDDQIKQTHDHVSGDLTVTSPIFYKHTVCKATFVLLAVRIIRTELTTFSLLDKCGYVIGNRCLLFSTTPTNRIRIFAGRHKIPTDRSNVCNNTHDSRHRLSKIHAAHGR